MEDQELNLKKRIEEKIVSLEQKVNTVLKYNSNDNKQQVEGFLLIANIEAVVLNSLLFSTECSSDAFIVEDSGIKLKYEDVVLKNNESK